MHKPLVVVTMGDPSGIGPEIVVKACADPAVASIARVLVIGDARVVSWASGIVGSTRAIRAVSKVEDALFEPDSIDVLTLDNVDMDSFRPGEVSAMCGKAAYEYIEKSVEITLSRKADAVATAPIHKEALRAAGVPYIGHTEIYGALTRSPDPLTMFEVRGLRVFFLTRHVSLRAACDMVTKERIKDYVRRCTEMLSFLGVSGGTMAIAGLNPHSGEHGLFGTEEVEEVAPAVEELRAEGFDVTGPVGADSVFHLALKGRYNSVLSLYHDQGHIATKTFDFERTIAITGGMPILRTSVDHGTAMDIAGKGIASEVSMAEAIRLAAKYSRKDPHR